MTKICRSCSVEHEIARHKGDWAMGVCLICEEYHALYEVVEGQANQGDKRASDEEVMRLSGESLE